MILHNIDQRFVSSITKTDFAECGFKPLGRPGRFVYTENFCNWIAYFLGFFLHIFSGKENTKLVSVHSKKLINIKVRKLSIVDEKEKSQGFLYLVQTFYIDTA